MDKNFYPNKAIMKKRARIPRVKDLAENSYHYFSSNGGSFVNDFYGAVIKALFGPKDWDDEIAELPNLISKLKTFVGGMIQYEIDNGGNNALERKFYIIF